ncbi:MAG: thioredoxin domain-containing protein [Gammaproteobacteria bacterium]
MISFVRRFGFWIFLALFFFWRSVVCHRKLSTGSPPPIDGQTIAGEPFNLKRLAGKPSVIYFWASWCGICATMDGMIGSLSESHPIITVAMQSGEGDELQAHK